MEVFDAVDTSSLLVWIADKLQLQRSTSTSDTLTTFVMESGGVGSITFPPRPCISKLVSSLDKAFNILRKIKDGFNSPRFNLSAAHVHGFSSLITSPPVDEDFLFWAQSRDPILPLWWKTESCPSLMGQLGRFWHL